MSLGLGVAGVGWLGESLIKDLTRVGGFTLVAVQDVVAGRAADVAARYAARLATQRFDDLLRHDAVHAIAICTPNALHAEQAQSALAAGKHVLVQKPLALSFADAHATIDAARRADRVLFVDYTYRFLETLSALRAELPDIGRSTHVRATFHNIYGPGAEKAWFFTPRLSGGGALMDLGVHLLDLGLWLLAPGNVALLEARLRGDGPVETIARLRLELDRVPFELDVSWNAPKPLTDISLEITAEHGVVRWENVEGSFFHFRALRDGRVLADRETTLREDTLRAFRAALAGGDAPPIDARVYALLDRAYARPAPAS